MVHWSLCGLGRVSTQHYPHHGHLTTSGPPTNILLPLNQRSRLIQDKLVFTQTTGRAESGCWSSWIEFPMPLIIFPTHNRGDVSADQVKEWLCCCLASAAAAADTSSPWTISRRKVSWPVAPPRKMVPSTLPCAALVSPEPCLLANSCTFGQAAFKTISNSKPFNSFPSQGGGRGDSYLGKFEIWNLACCQVVAFCSQMSKLFLFLL